MRWSNPPTYRRSRRPRRRATARCARGWSRFREECRAEHPDWWNAPVPAFGDRDAWLAIVGLAPGKHGANRTGRPFTGDYAGELLYATLLKFGLAEGDYGADPADGLRLTGRDHPQRGQMPAAREQARAERDRDLPPLFRSRARRVAERPGADRPRPDRACRDRGPRARPAALIDQVRPRRRKCRARRPRAAVELPLLALQPEHARRLDAAMFESVFERAMPSVDLPKTMSTFPFPASRTRKAPAFDRGKIRRRRGVSSPPRGRASRPARRSPPRRTPRACRRARRR